MARTHAAEGRVTQQEVVLQLCDKHFSAAVNQHATIVEATFSVGSLQGYITRISCS
jgi:hypothetical protein